MKGLLTIKTLTEGHVTYIKIHLVAVLLRRKES